MFPYSFFICWNLLKDRSKSEYKSSQDTTLVDHFKSNMVLSQIHPIEQLLTHIRYQTCFETICFWKRQHCEDTVKVTSNEIHLARQTGQSALWRHHLWLLGLKIPVIGLHRQSKSRRLNQYIRNKIIISESYDIICMITADGLQIQQLTCYCVFYKYCKCRKQEDCEIQVVVDMYHAVFKFNLKYLKYWLAMVNGVST